MEDNSSGRFTTVALPLPHEGIGKALRASFRPTQADLPNDMLDLLALLDRH